MPAAGAEPGWLYYGGDQGGRHYSEAAQIDRSKHRTRGRRTFRSGDMATYGEEMKDLDPEHPILLPAAAGESLVLHPFNRAIALDRQAARSAGASTRRSTTAATAPSAVAGELRPGTPHTGR